MSKILSQNTNPTRNLILLKPGQGQLPTFCGWSTLR